MKREYCYRLDPPVDPAVMISILSGWNSNVRPKHVPASRCKTGIRNRFLD